MRETYVLLCDVGVLSSPACFLKDKSSSWKGYANLYHTRTWGESTKHNARPVRLAY